jgi:hypothetical protein
MSEHGFCPNCHVDLDGGSIWDHFFKETRDPEEADRIAELYGATRTKGQWGRAIGLYPNEEDRTVKWRCPDCGHEWKR